jgi:hypothetical protein
MQSKTCAVLITTRREERIERFTPDIETHATAIVGENNLDVIMPGCLRLDVDCASFATRKCVRDRVQEEVG